MAIKFTKMHGLGNDFMVIDAINQHITLRPEDIASLSKRNTGIGFDQCLLIEPALIKDIDFNYRIFNADGREVGQCGNGARCLALFAKHNGLTAKNAITVATKTTRMQLRINDDNTVSVDMGVPNLEPEKIPFIAEKKSELYSLELTNETAVTIHAISVGNPHALVLIEDIHCAPVNELGVQISTHSRFPEQTNTGFIQILNPEHILLRVYERGCGETQACGSGAVAAAAIGRLYHGLSNKVRVTLPGGDLTINWPNINETITLTGPAFFIYEATLCDEYSF